MARKYQVSKKSGLNGWGCFLLFLAFCIIISYWYIILPIGAGTAYFFYRDQIHAFLLRDKIKQVRETIYSIQSGYAKRERILIEKGESKASIKLTKTLENELNRLEELLHQTQKYLDDTTYEEAIDTLHLRFSLRDTPQQATEGTESLDEQEARELTIANIAPEILSTYQNVQRDHETILQKLGDMEAHNTAELLAIHETNMRRFTDILEGYLKIKQSPKDYYHADERLKRGKAALEQFDQELDETLRQFNEADLQDFEISLRMLSKEEKG